MLRLHLGCWSGGSWGGGGWAGKDLEEDKHHLWSYLPQEESWQDSQIGKLLSYSKGKRAAAVDLEDLGKSRNSKFSH